MSSAPAAAAPEGAEASPKKKSGKGKLILLAVPLLLAGLLAGLWFTGILPGLLGLGEHEAGHAGAETVKAAPPPVFVDLPEIVANLNSGSNRQSYLKLQARLEVAKPEDVERIKAAMPRLQDMFQTYLREMRPEELRGSAGTYRLREELIVRANLAAAPARVTDVLFTQMLIQ
ncbi:MAG: flagellar basal body-associated FliL family protein [Rhodospirillales bacterium]|nr:flagellar basal body-associated FliL family protein [Rhodospirillales bacterium]